MNTNQPEEEEDRLRAVLEAAKAGSVETLIVRSRYSKLDMLNEPERIREEPAEIDRKLTPACYVADQFSIARDAQYEGIAESMNPNDFESNEVKKKVEHGLNGDVKNTMEKWSEKSVGAGPAWGVHEVCKTC